MFCGVQSSLNLLHQEVGNLNKSIQIYRIDERGELIDIGQLDFEKIKQGVKSMNIDFEKSKAIQSFVQQDIKDSKELSPEEVKGVV